MAKILLVEDDVLCSTLLKECLLADGYCVEACNDGLEASRLLETYSYDLLILDWQLPGQSGISTLKQYRKNDGKAPALILTGKTLPQDKVTGLDAGADDYMCKPVNNLELCARVRALLRRASGNASNRLRLGNVVVDLKGHTVSVEERQIDLLPREYALFEFLARNPNKVFTYEEIGNSVWPMNCDVAYETIRTCIKRIRQKLGADEEHIIRNIYGVGYVLDSRDPR